MGQKAKLECLVFGGLLLDRYLEMETYPQRGQDVLLTNDFDAAGGCAVNMAVTFLNLGGLAHVVSYIGNDQRGREILAYLDQHGMSQKYVKQTEGETGYCLILLEKNGERTFLTRKGAECVFDKALLETGSEETAMQNVMVTGYYLLCDQTQELAACLTEISQRCDHFLFDPGPLVDEIDPWLMREVLSMATIITLNEVEAELVVLPEDPEKLIVIKRGKSGGEVRYRGKQFTYQAKETETVDTTGAGDSFAAGLMYGVLSGIDIKASIGLAAECAAITVTRKGPHGFWRREEG